MSKKRSLVYIARAALCAALVAVSSFITLPLPVAPVTLQTFAVCTVAGLLGFRWAMVSVSVYILLGAAGLPVFSGFGGGVGVLMGAGGGYIWGFLLIAAVVGICSDKFGADFSKMLLSMALGMVLCYSLGTLWYTFVYSDGSGALAALSTCVLPFILPDAVKIIAAATVVSRLKKRIG